LAKEGLTCKIISVMDPHKRRLFRKSLLELWNIIKLSFGSNSEDIIIVSCLLPTTLFLLEIFNKFFGFSNIYLLLHGELEGLFNKEVQGIKSYGYWVKFWIRIRSCSSKLNLLVMDDFIRDLILREFPHKIDPSKLDIIHHPIFSIKNEVNSTDMVCFIGYKTRDKGFSFFEKESSTFRNLNFVAIGGGQFENLSTGDVEFLADSSEYLDRIGSCVVAVFPYEKNYNCTLSAAALDALSTGVHIIATDRPFFLSLAEYFGDEVISIYRTTSQFHKLLGDDKSLSDIRARRIKSREIIEKSKYSLAFVALDLEVITEKHISHCWKNIHV
jgi:hypothetical protein